MHTRLLCAAVAAAETLSDGQNAIRARIGGQRQRSYDAA